MGPPPLNVKVNTIENTLMDPYKLIHMSTLNKLMNIKIKSKSYSCIFLKSF